jgi:hypothetical protein
VIDAYIGLKMQEVTRLRMSTHPVELRHCTIRCDEKAHGRVSPCHRRNPRKPRQDAAFDAFGVVLSEVAHSIISVSISGSIFKTAQDNGRQNGEPAAPCGGAFARLACYVYRTTDSDARPNQRSGYPPFAERLSRVQSWHFDIAAWSHRLSSVLKSVLQTSAQRRVGNTARAGVGWASSIPS